jgi:SAM-dependent methyltransferase
MEQAMTHSFWEGMDHEIQKQLSLQVDLSLRRHHDFMVAHGLQGCGHVVDLGTGSGRFLASVAAQHPTIEFHGIDDKPHMVRAAAGHRLPNVDWCQSDALSERAAQLLRTADGVLMRNIVLHLPNTATALGQILKGTRPGTRLWVFDVDLDECRCVPDSPAFQAFLGWVREFCGRGGVEIRTGAELPAILAANGFAVDEVAVEPFNSRAINRSQFAEYLLREASLYYFALYGRPAGNELHPLRELLTRHGGDGSHFVQYGMVMVGAEKRPA